MSRYSTWDNYVWTQLIRQLRLDTVDTTITLEHSRQDVTLGHSKWNIYVRTQGQLYQDTLNGIVTMVQSRQYSQLHYDTVDLIITLGHTTQDSMRQLCQNTVEWKLTCGYSR